MKGYKEKDINNLIENIINSLIKNILKNLKSNYIVSMFIFFLIIFSSYYSFIKSSIDTKEVISSNILSINKMYNKSFAVVPNIFIADDKKNISTITRREVVNKPMYSKEVFLTFDDGPSKKNTVEIVKILKKNGVKATFFVIGSLAESNKDVLKMLDDSGMTILPHCYHHDYGIYNSEERYFNDLNKCTDSLQKITGRILPPFVRMPGGSDNHASSKTTLYSIKTMLKSKNIFYIDWNVSSEDASVNLLNSNIIKRNVINQCRERKLSVILMHDAPNKTTTVDALQDIIKELKGEGFEFRTFNDLNRKEFIEMKKRKIINKD